MTDSAAHCAPPDFAPRKPLFVVPDNACDCHAHILCPASEFAYAAARVYTPSDCLLPSYRDMLDTLGVTRAVWVQPSVCGTDNEVLLRALAQSGPLR